MANRFPDDFLLQLRQASDIVSLFRTYTEIKRRGRTYVCNCPFHSERTPSCTIYPDTQSFYCYGCHVGGDAITFTMQIENLPYLEAVRMLAEQAGLTVPSLNPQDLREEQRKARLRERILEINRLTANFYYRQLVSPQDRTGLAYFVARGLRPDTIKKYGLGYASSSFYTLRDYLHAQGYTEEEMLAANVCRKGNRGMYDNFRNRVMFPIVDLRGNIIGFGGRVLDDSKPKYLNTAQTPVFDKGENLFSLNHAKNALRESKGESMILAEGYMDVIAIHQAGFQNVVATLGTAITAAQARNLSNYVKEIIIAYDSDTAGQNATQKAMNHFSAVGVTTRILKIEGAKDPDEYIKTYGAERFALLLQGADGAIPYQLARCRQGLDLQREDDKAQLLKRSVGVLAGIQNTLERQVYITKLSKEMEIPMDVLREQVEYTRKGAKKQERVSRFREIQRLAVTPSGISSQERIQKGISTTTCKAEEQILIYLLQNPEHCAMVMTLVSCDHFATSIHRSLFVAVCECIHTYHCFSLSLLVDKLTSEEVSEIARLQDLSHRLSVSQDCLEDCIATLQQSQVKAQSQHSDMPKEQDADLLAIANEKQFS